MTTKPTYPADWNVTFAPSATPAPDYEFGRQTRTLRAGSIFPPAAMPLPCDVLWERDVALGLRDGTTIYADILRPAGVETPLPALIAWSPYGKTIPAARLTPSVPADWQSGIAKFEGPDPAFWAAHGYAVVNPDPRGVGRSGGDALFWGSADGQDGYDVVEWVAEQNWCNGKVALHGTSWLAISQWFIAAENPPHLAAIAPWNGFSDVYRDHLAVGGIPTVDFMAKAAPMIAGGQTTEMPHRMIEGNQGRWTEYWQDKSANLEGITIPAYVTVDGATILHRTGTFEGFRRLGSEDKWLRVNDTNEWHDQYNPMYTADLLRFFDHYLKDADNGWASTPRVRVSVLDRADDVPADTAYEAWPLPDTEYNRYYLNGDALTTTVPEDACTTYDSTDGRVSFTVTFDADQRIIGYPMARLYVETDGADDMDLFVEVQKIGVDGQLIATEGTTAVYHGNNPVTGAPGSLRVSLRRLDERLSTNFRPIPGFTESEKLASGQIIPVDIAIMPIARAWHAGESLRLTIGGTPSPEIVKANLSANPTSSVNSGRHIIHTGQQFPSYLQLPHVSAGTAVMNAAALP